MEQFYFRLETVLGKYIIANQKTDKTLFPSVVILAAPEISKGAEMCIRDSPETATQRQ